MKLGVKNKVLICLIQSVSRLMEKTELASAHMQVKLGIPFPFRDLGNSCAGRELPKHSLVQPPHIIDEEGKAQGGPTAH